MNIQALIDLYNQNSTNQYLTTLAVFVFSLLVLYLFKSYVLHAAKKLSKKTKTDLDDYAVEFAQQVHWPFYFFLSLFLAIRPIIVPDLITKVIGYILIFLFIFYIVKGISKISDYITKKQIDKQIQLGDEHDAHHIKLLGGMFKAFVWLIASLLLLSNLGVNITSLIAGLGVGGIAIAFALQNVLTDLFSAFTIYFDKPFKVGDFIVIGNDKGVIKKIGLKSTRIQALQGEELVVSNRELTSTRINNYKKMQKRRIVFSFGVEYGTKLTKLKKTPAIIKKIFRNIDHTKIDRVHFHNFGASSLDFEVVYYLDSNEYAVYMDTQQEINLAIVKSFEEEGIAMAFPTQTIHIKK
jgi:small-conductance mechanosensitive channel